MMILRIAPRCALPQSYNHSQSALIGLLAHVCAGSKAINTNASIRFMAFEPLYHHIHLYISIARTIPIILASVI